MKGLTLQIVLLLWLLPTLGESATYYVATTGTDSAACTQSQPCQTLNRGVSLLQAGDTLVLRGGTYTPGALGQHGTGTIASGSSWSTAITIAASPGETVRLVGPNAGIALLSESYLVFDGLTIEGGNLFVCCQAHHIRFQNGAVKHLASSLVIGDASHLEVLQSTLEDAQVEYVAAWGSSAGSYGVYWSGRDSLFEGNTILNNTGYGVHVYASGQNNVNNNVVRNNRMSGNGFHDPRGYAGYGVLLATGTGNQAVGNTIEGNGAGVQVDYRCTDCIVAHNTITNNRGAGISIGASAVRTRVCANHLAGNGGGLEDHGSGTIADPCPAPPAGGVPAPAPPAPPAVPAPRNLRLLTVVP